MFTNVPVHATIEIILQHIYHHTSLPPLKISPNILRKLLLACTTQVPFYDHKDNIYIQIDGVSMGSALGPLFANFYMGHLEDKIFQVIDKPSIYLRYVDDILVLTEKVSDIEDLKQVLHSNSVLTFTHELNVNNKIPFLDVLIDTNGHNFETSTYKKPTSINSCLINYKSECPFRYKTAVIKNLIKRSKLISSSNTIFYNELRKIKQTLVNNGFPNHVIDEQINLSLKTFNDNNNSLQNNEPTNIDLYYNGQMHPNYIKDEKALTNIIRRYITPTDPNKHLRFIIYYKKFKTANLVINNNSSPQINKLQKTNLVYRFTCPLGDCISNVQKSSYIGYTTTTLSRRLTCHLTEHSSIKKHISNIHNCPSSNIRKILIDNTTILATNNNKIKLQILEALFIKNQHPSINRIGFESGQNILTCL